MYTCEDYPCCGHRQGECEDKPEYTAEYWSKLHDEMGDERYELYLEALERQEQGY
jgi:hypothetical protein